MNEEILEMLTDLRPEFDYSDSEDFIEDGLLDSFDIIALTSMLQDKYGVLIDGLDIVPESYASVDAIINLIEKSGGKEN